MSTAWRANGPPWTRSLVVAPRNHGTLLPAAPQATSTSALAAGTSGRRTNTSAATAAIAIENRTMLQPSSSAADAPGTAHVTDVSTALPPRSSRYGRGPPAGRATAPSSTAPAQASIDRPSTASTRSPAWSPGCGSSIGLMTTPAADHASS